MGNRCAAKATDFRVDRQCTLDQGHSGPHEYQKRMYDIYLASSWRNQDQPEVLFALREWGYTVYDFKHPDPDDESDQGFHWSEIDTQYKKWTARDLRDKLAHPIAQSGFKKDYNALADCLCCVLLLPSGRSAHLEAGFAIGSDIPTVVMAAANEEIEPELMYLLSKGIVCSLPELQVWCNQFIRSTEGDW